MINMDGPPHARLRKAVARAFSPRLLARLTDGVRTRATRIVDDVVAQAATDFVTQVAQRLPVEVICDLLGIPERHHATVSRHGNTLVGFGGPGPHFCLGANLARLEVTAMLRELLTRLPDIRAVGEPDMLLSNFTHGVKRLRFTI